MGRVRARPGSNDDGPNSIRPDDADRYEGTVAPILESDAKGHGWLVRLRWPALVAGLLLAGAGLTYLLVPPTIVAEQAITVDPGDLVAASEREAQPMPSVLGLNRDVAQTVLDDAGLSGVNLVVTDQPAAGPVSMVVAQSPSAGTDSVTNIELTVSVPAPMPDVLGKSMIDGRSDLETLGAVVEIVPQFNPSVPKNQIIDITPKPGETMPTVVSLVVGDPGDALTLAAVKSVADDYCRSVDSATVNGTAVGDSIACKPGRKVAFAEYALSRQAAALEVLVGTDDRGKTGAARVVVFGDGRELAAADVWLGQSVPIRADLNGVMRLRIEVSTADTEQNPTVILGDAKLLGLPDGLDAIAAQ